MVLLGCTQADSSMSVGIAVAFDWVRQAVCQSPFHAKQPVSNNTGHNHTTILTVGGMPVGKNQAEQS